MSWYLPEREDGPRSTPPAMVAFARAEEALGAARTALDAAAQVDWVSTAADGYRRLLSDAAGDLARFTATVGAARSPVLRHTRAADAAREAVENECWSSPFAVLGVCSASGRWAP